MRQGKQGRQAAQLVGAHERTARQWVAWYRQGGTDLVRGKRQGGQGQPARLNQEQQEQLRQHASVQGFTSAKDAQGWIQKQCGVAYAQPGVYSLFKRLRIKKKVPRPQNAKADPQVQQAFKKGA